MATMLRRIQRLAATHAPLLSSIERQACAASTSAATAGSAGSSAASGKPSPLEFSRLRAQQRAALSELRKAWAIEFAEKRVAQAQAEASIAKK